MNLGLQSLGERALALLGLAALEEDSSAVVVIEAEGPAATAPEPKEPGDPAPDQKETGMNEAELAAALDGARLEASVAATKAANDRWNAVLGHKAAEGRSKLAASLLNTALSAEEVIAQLEVAGAETPKAEGASSLQQRMQGEPNPNITSDAPAGEQKRSANWLGNKMAASGKKGA